MREKLYKYASLPNGLCSVPRKFTKLLKPPLAKLKLDYIKIVVYIGNLIKLTYSCDIWFKNVRKWVKLLGNLDFVVHLEKSVFVPLQEVEYLGFIIKYDSITVQSL